MKKLDAEPRLQGAHASVVEWARKVAQAVNSIVDNFAKVVSKAGDTMTGDLTINKINPTLILDAKATTTSAIVDFRRAGQLWWSLDAYSPDSDFYIDRYVAGVYANSPVRISNATGAVTLAGNLTASSVNAGPTGGFTVNSFYADGANFASRALSVNPNWAECLLQGYHVPGNWAGLRLLLNTASPAVIEFRNNASIWCNGVQLTSDASLKENVEPVAPTAALAQALAIPVRTYERIDDVDMSTDFGPVQRATAPRYLGVFAQDVQTQRPELVRVNGHGLLSVDYSGLAALAIGAVQGLHARIDTQQQLIDAMRAELDILKGA